MLKAITSGVLAKMLDGKFVNVWSGTKILLLWAAKTTIGNMSLACMAGKMGLLIYGPLIGSKQPLLNAKSPRKTICTQL
jgi:hypothetical protein